MTQLMDYVPESLYDELDFNQQEEFSHIALVGADLLMD